jgi:rare lipoprotein A
MNSKSVTVCVFAGTILASTVGAANSSPLHSHRGTYYAHYTHARVADLGSHHRVFHRSRVATLRRTHAVADTEHTNRSDKPTLAKAAITSGLMSGIASVYSGGHTANGEVASAGGLTAAHRSLPFGTMVKVTNKGTGRSVVVRINDRGPFVHGRVIDLTPAAARAIGFSGLAPVTLSVVSRS